MPDGGTAESRNDAATSHISTAEWQSFEIRMRRRRAQRCLLRAEVALEAGFIEDARTALDEAKRLDAPAEEIARIEALIPAAGEDLILREDVPAPVLDELEKEPERRGVGWIPFAAAAIIAVGASIFGIGALWQTPPAPVADAEPAAETPAVASDTVQNVPVRVDNVLAVPTSGIDSEPAVANASESAVVSETLPETPATAGPEATKALDTTPAPRLTAPQPQALSAASTLPVPRPTLTAPPVLNPSPDPPARETTPGTTPAARVVPTVDPVPSLSAAPPAPPPRDESADVRAVLARYENAYTQLNPAAARAVWPDVDERALSRAFSGLASQRVSLGRCDVAVNGGTARATCVGTATWTPKVGGGGSRTEARRWTFDLRKAGDAWQIERATAR